jgi:hypothetical protein
MNNTRFLIRATGENPWNEISILRLWNRIEECLNAGLVVGQFDFSNASRAPQVVTEFDVSFVKSAAPKNAAVAKEEGYLREENPFRPGTAAHAKWDQVYLRHGAWPPK